MKLSIVALAVLLIAAPVFADDLDDSYKSLKEAEAKKDLAQMKRLAGETSALARQAVAETAPDGVDKEAWNNRINYVREIDVYTEYVLYSAALQGPAETTIDLLSTLEKQNPKSKYLDQAYGVYFAALTKQGESAKILPIAEKALASLPDNEDLLLVLADSAMSKQQYDRAFSLSNRLVAALANQSKPEGVSASDWESKRSLGLGRGYYYAGMVSAMRNSFLDADRNLRAALPFIRGNNAMAGPALFQLGIANYRLGMATNNKQRVLQGAKYSDESAQINSSVAQDAFRNARAMRLDAAKMR
jgi:tetratricopeptide (TPR) repeat protein